MALIRKCDRCGKVYHHYSNNDEDVKNDSNCNLILGINGAAFIHIQDCHEADLNTTRIIKGYDLCPTCLKNMKLFLDGAKLNLMS